MTTKEYLESKKIEDPKQSFSKDLSLMRASTLLNRIFSKNKLSAAVASNALKLLKLPSVYHSNFVTMGSSEVEKFRDWVSADMWDKKENFTLLEYFFGTEMAPLVKAAWRKVPLKMYQNSYGRRSFRAPNHSEYLLVGRINFLRSLLNFSNDGEYGSRSYFNLGLTNQVRFDNYIDQNHNQFMLWAAALDQGDQKLYQLFEDIIFNNDQTAKVTRNVIKALLFTEREDCWVLVEKLLLAAQRQEGLRQIILESLDETSHGAFLHIIQVLLENKLTRFSSVVRAIDTWTGLAWDAEKESTVKMVLNYAHDFLSHPELIPSAMNSKNNIEIYMALWSQGVMDIQKTEPYLHELLRNGTFEKKCLAVYFSTQTHDPYLEMPLYFSVLKFNDLQLFSFALYRLNDLLKANRENKVYVNNPSYPNFFEILVDLADGIEVKEKEFKGKVFSWMNSKFERDLLYSCAVQLIGDNDSYLRRLLEKFEVLSISLREELTKTVLQEYAKSQYHYQREENKTPGAPSSFQKEFALNILGDRSENIVSIAHETLKHAKLQESDWEKLLPLYQRKSSKLKLILTQLTWKQSDAIVSNNLDYLLNQGDTEQRYSALDLMLQLKRQNRLESFINDRLSNYQAKDKLSARELNLLKQLEPEVKLEELSAENGYGFYKSGNFTDYELPKPDYDGLFATNSRKNDYGFSMPLRDIRKQLQLLTSLFNEHQNYEYDVQQYNGVIETVLLGNTFQRKTYRYPENWTGEQRFADIPLYEVWEDWYNKSGLQAEDLFLLTFAQTTHYDDFRSWISDYVYYFEKDLVKPFGRKFYVWNSPLCNIIKALQLKFPFYEKQNFLLDATANLYSKMTSSILNFRYEPKRNEYWHYNSKGNGWQVLGLFDVFLVELDLNVLDDEQIQKAWNLYRWRQFSGHKENVQYNQPPLYLYCKMFDLKKISENDLYEGLISEDSFRDITVNFEKEQRRHINYGKEFPWLKEYVDRIQNKFLDIELKRGDSGTSVTRLCGSFQTIHGVNRFVELITGLGKLNLYRGYIYSWGNEVMSKQQSFSYLLKRCFPLSSDSQDTFSALMFEHKISEKRLIEAAIYAPQWQAFISNFLDWKGLDAGIWWMHAHTKTASYVAVNAELESEVAKYSELDILDFQNGAVDKDWFDNAYKKLGKTRWELLYNAAKYVTDGNGHRRARLYSDTLTGDLKIREVTAKVKDKRDQDYLRVFGLVPLSKTNPDNDVLKRYEYLIQFKKESKEYGSMRQSSEALAIQVAMDNLARNAGYPDPIRLTWAMETKQVQQIFSKETQHEIDGYTLTLDIDQEGKTSIGILNKEQKAIKTVPVGLKKNPLYLELAHHKKVLNEQFRRSRKSLEEAMVRGDEFTSQEILNLCEHPVIQKHLTKLVLVVNDEQLFWLDGLSLKNLNSELFEIENDQKFRIAHVVDFHRLKQWVDFQRYCFDKKLKQPFKQIFRELYVPTPDELKEKALSRRYAGHQVNPSQTLALLKSRGWKVDYEEGLQKVFHQQGFQVKLYAMADWFSPADVEAPTLETIEFHSLKNYENIALDQIEPRIFSEVMRDLDLVVSVAHVGGVDPESSQSTIEMRSALVRETMRLFTQDNVKVSGNHALIEGKMAQYSVHLGSAVVHQVPGKYLSILPVHSQHRGRLFLPFADDDPKSAELLSKVLLLAQDDKIQDPTILRQIESN